MDVMTKAKARRTAIDLVKEASAIGSQAVEDAASLFLDVSDVYVYLFHAIRHNYSFTKGIQGPRVCPQ